ncbi:PREDICTED: uncharacterized protein LOC106324196 [Brassica oleracea var. oleracea]|uniref:uncharacterized protein LOC106324196 n=1 Tax=Brassica oleracea var. oleracea TaxID=109376 RepID=UPI0006A70ED4|nr:PREDICTED: uncharacterized protein LOC106324196 [Brassica oleracea var. oleracea]
MSSSSSDEVFEERFDEVFEEIFEDTFTNIVEAQTSNQRSRAYIERNREGGQDRLWNDYFSEDSTISSQLFRHRFRMNKDLFLHIVHGLSENIPFFQQRRDATERFGLSVQQKCTAAIRMLAYGSAADTVDEYLRLGETTALSCTLNDINVLDQSPVFDDLLEGRAPRVRYMVNRHMYKLTYYLTDGIYPKWLTFIQSIKLPQCPKQELFANVQEAAGKDVERVFGVLQARFGIVKNPVRT